MRATRVIYVENDPALRGIVAKFLAERAEIDLILTAANADGVVEILGVSRGIDLGFK